MRTVHFEQLRPHEIMEEKNRCPVVYVPIGPLEWHGPHLPYGTDPLNAAAVSERVAQEVGGVVLPTLFWGTERERSAATLKSIGFEGNEWVIGMDFPANTMPSFYCREEVFGIIIHEQLSMLVRQGYKLIMLMNGHGAINHMNVLKRLAAQFSAESGVRVVHEICLQSDKGLEGLGHATEIETSLLMHLHPGSVDLNQLPPKGEKIYSTQTAIVDEDAFHLNPAPDFSVQADPRDSTVESGRATFENTVRLVTALVQKELAQLNK